MNTENLKPFPKGTSGNPNGRPKGSRNRSTLIKEWLEIEFKQKNPITGKVEILEIQDHLVIAQIMKAIKGDTVAFNTLMDGAYGKQKESLKLEQNTDYFLDLSPERARDLIQKLETNILGSLELTHEEELEIIRQLKNTLEKENTPSGLTPDERLAMIQKLKQELNNQ